MKATDRHYRAYVGPPDRYDYMGGLQFKVLFEHGLREDHKLLDIGCGSLRAGRLFIPYLLPGNYYGVEPNKWLVRAGIQHELGHDIFQVKRPHFAYCDDFNFGLFEADRFDFILAQSVFSHAPRHMIERCLESAAGVMDGDTLFLATFRVGWEDHQGSEWLYPGRARYTRETIHAMVSDAGLRAAKTNCEHPSQTWYIITKGPHE